MTKRQYDRRYKAQHKDEWRAYQKRRQAEYKRQWNAAKGKQYRSDNKHRISKQQKKYRETHPDYHKKYIAEHRQQKNQYDKEFRARLKIRVIRHYSHGEMKCKHCGYSDIRALSIDHIGGGGCAHRKQIGKRAIYQWLKDSKYPDGFQVLCMNCQFIKRFEMKEHR